ncbi:MAG: FHA domain-containing protein [Chloroflexota bacterium]
MLTTETRVNYGTRDLREAMPEFQQNDVFDTSGTGDFREGMRLVLEIEDTESRLELDPSRRDLVVGRRDPVSRRKPDVDLEDHEGYRHGVSRKHAMFTLMNQQLSLQDYGSANGTYLNGIRLPAHQAHKVHNGDVMRLGHMAIRIYFVSDDKPDGE